jgi:EXS family/SPX domain
MVEFGLKLEDNKVSEWNDHYIEYEKLKSILTKASVSVKKIDELTQRKPEITIGIIHAYKAGIVTPFQSAADLSGQDVTAISSSGGSADAQKSNLITIHEIVTPGNNPQLLTTEKSELIDLTSSNSYGTASAISGSLSPLSSIDPTKKNLISRALVKATTGVSDYLQKSFERSVRDTLKDIDAVASEFDDSLKENIRRVNSFYDTHLDELKGQIEYLKETVKHVRRPSLGGQQQSEPPPPVNELVEQPSTTPEADKNETPLIQYRKNSNFGALTAAKAYFSKQMHRQSLQHHSDGHAKSESLSDSSAFMALLIGNEGDDDVLGGDEYQPPEAAAKVREVESIRRALIDSYRTAKLLSNFAIMNYTGFVKIVKKYDKTFPKDRRGRYAKDIVPSNVCDEGLSVEALASRMEVLYAHWFCDRNVSEARAQMMIKKSDGLEMDWSQLRLGYRMGMCSILALWVCWDCVWGMVKDHQSTIGGRTAFPVFRSCGGLLMLHWCWGVSVWVWSRYRINYIYLFDFNPSIVASPLVIFNEAVDNTLFYFICALLYYKAGAHDIPWPLPAGVFPFILLLYTVYQLIFPIRIRAPMWENIWQVLKAPLSSPTFFHGYIGDIFTSMVKVFQDLVWAFFFVASGDWLISEDSTDSTYHSWSRSTWYTNILIPLITLLPLWIRFNQCLRRYTDTGNRFPHLANAFKYALSQTVTLFGAFHPLYMRNERESQIFQFFWMFAFVASSLYSFSWDLFMVCNNCISTIVRNMLVWFPHL